MECDIRRQTQPEQEVSSLNQSQGLSAGRGGRIMLSNDAHH